MTDTRKYELSYPEEPPVGTVVEAATGIRFQRYNDDPARPGFDVWFALTPEGKRIVGHSTYSWRGLLKAYSDGFTDVTPSKTYALPEMPPVGTKLAGTDKGNGTTIEFEVRQDGSGTRLYLYTDAMPFQWNVALQVFGPLTDIR